MGRNQLSAVGSLAPPPGPDFEKRGRALLGLIGSGASTSALARSGAAAVGLTAAGVASKTTGTTGDALLLEDGTSFLLLEGGTDKLLLEQ